MKRNPFVRVTVATLISSTLTMSAVVPLEAHAEEGRAAATGGTLYTEKTHLFRGSALPWKKYLNDSEAAPELRAGDGLSFLFDEVARHLDAPIGTSWSVDIKLDYEPKATRDLNPVGRSQLEAAFLDQLLQHGLTYKLDNTRYVLTVKLQMEAEKASRFIYLKNIAPSNLTDKQQGLRTSMSNDVELFSIDGIDNQVLLKGEKGKVEDTAKRIKELDQYYSAGNSTNGYLDPEELVEQVVHLTWGSVSATNATVQGENVTIPGIVDSLRAFGANVVQQGTEGIQTANPRALRPSSPTSPTREPTKPRAPVWVSVDERSNAVILKGERQEVEKLAAIVRELDREQPLVDIQVQIIQGNDTLSRDIGVRWGTNALIGDNAGQASGSGNTDLGSSSLASTNNLVSTDISTATKGSGMLSLLSNGSSSSTLSFLYRGSRSLLDAQIAALEQNNRAETISAPRVVTLNNIPAQIISARNFNYLVVDQEKGLSTGIESVRTGISLKITPSVLGLARSDDSNNRLIRMVINAKNSAPDTTGASGSQVSTTEQEVFTTVAIPGGRTFVLGGLFDTVRSKSNDGVPILKDVPLLGGLFRHSVTQNEKKETVFLITPKVVPISRYVESKADRRYTHRYSAHLERQRGALNESLTRYLPETIVPTQLIEEEE